MDDRTLVLLTTVPNETKGREIALNLVEKRLAACVTVSRAARSFYRWEGRIEDAEEWILFIKTKAGLYGKIEAELKAVHPYAVPEIIALPVVAGHPAYLKWISGETLP
ncbi:MAG: divalent-cation tolerance protein CutA [Candidatus Aminicenantes bacterium]|nr:divalent-cation tolerance protein CutA [Candidatus Aminicenantes bacterium]